MKRSQVQHLKINFGKNLYVDEFGAVYNNHEQVLTDFRTPSTVPLKSPIPFCPYTIHKGLQKLRKVRNFKFFAWEFKVAPTDYSFTDYLMHGIFRLFSPLSETLTYQKLHQLAKMHSYGKKVFKSHKVVNLPENDKEVYVVAMNHYINSFGHLMINILPALYMAHKNLPKNAKYLIPQIHNPTETYFNPYTQYLNDVLDAFHIKPEQRIYLQPNELVHFKELNFVSILDENDALIRNIKNYSFDVKQYVSNKNPYKYLIDYFYDPKIAEQFKGYENIYMSRKARGNKIILNEKNLEKELEILGFKIIEIADYSFIEALHLFQYVEKCITLGGSNFLNLLWSPNKIKTILFADYMGYNSPKIYFLHYCTWYINTILFAYQWDIIFFPYEYIYKFRIKNKGYEYKIDVNKVIELAKTL